MMLLVIFFAMFFHGCKNSDRKDYISEWDKEEAEKETNLEIAADSIVHLSFGGLALSEPAAPMINKAMKDKKIWDIKQNRGDEIIRFKSNIFLPKRENPLCVDVRVTTFQDSISSIAVISTDYDTYTELIDLYMSRYNEKYASPYGDNHSELWRHEDNIIGNSSKSEHWIYKNQTLCVSNYYDNEEKVYVKNPKMKSPENRYGKTSTNYFKSVVVLYRDIELCKKAEENKKAVEAQLKVEQQKESGRKQIQSQIKASEQDI